MTQNMLPIVPTDQPPQRPGKVTHDFAPSLIVPGEHPLCPGCGEPIAIRSVVEMIAELGVTERTVGVFGIGCYTTFAPKMDVEVAQALHGRAPSLATGIKRMLPDNVVFTIQGDGDMANEGLQEVVHTAARGENVTCIMLNNGVFGETGGHMTSTTVLGQRTKSSLDGRDAKLHGLPIMMSNLLATLDGVAFVARCAVNSGPNITRARRWIKKAFETQIAGAGFSFIEILTMCPTGWFIDTLEGPDYLKDKIAPVHKIGVVKDTTKDAKGIK